MYDRLRQEVCEANQRLHALGLAAFTWGNASGIDREHGVVAIKPSGVCYEQLTPDKIVLLNLTGEILEGSLRPSSDTPTHLYLYCRLPELGGIVHTHSKFATAFAQAGQDIPALGTTHADYFYGPVRCAHALTDEEIAGCYESNTGRVLLEALQGQEALAVPGMLAAGHGPFTWGRNALEAADNSGYLEMIAEMAFYTMQLGAGTPIAQALLDRHYLRKHGKNAYYGQTAADDQTGG